MNNICIKKIKPLLLLSIAISISLYLPTAYQHFIKPDHKANNAAPHINLLSESGKRSFMSMEGVTFIELLDQKMNLKIQAKEAHVRNRKMGFFRVASQKVTEMEDVTISFYEKDREIISISSNHSILYLGINNVLFKGNVRCLTKEGKTLKTEKLFWDNKKKILMTKDDYVYIANEGPIKRGKGFESDHKLEKIKFGT